MNREKKTTPFHFVPFRLLLLTNTIVITGGIMAFGLLALFVFGMNQDNAMWILAVIPPMALVSGVSTWIALRAVRGKMERLLESIKAVAEGNLDVRLDTRGADEYTPIYEGFNRMTRELKATKEEMVEFTNDFSHEFKTPITSILGFSELLIQTGEKIESPERMQYLQVIAEESRRLSELSQKTLLLSKVDACQIITDRVDFDLGEQLRHCAILLLPQIERKRIELELDVPKLTYCGNAELLEQVWVNLLTNAIKFTPEGGEIGISAKAENNTITVWITDSGVGMDKETQAKIFEKYYQHDAGHSARGSGIGLSIARRIVILCNGKIEVESSPGEGSVFTVTLPCSS